MHISDDGFHQPETSPLHVRDGLILVLVELRVPGLELGHICLERLLGVGDLPLLGLDERFQLRGVDRHEPLDLRPPRLVAQVDIPSRARRHEVLPRELPEDVEGASALVVLQVGRVAPLERGVAADAVLVAQRLALGGSVHVGDEGGGGIGEFGH